MLKTTQQQGFSLIELLLVLAIVAALGVAAFVIYPRVQTGRLVTYESQILSSANASIKAVYQSGNFGTIDTATVIGIQAFPENMLDTPATLAHHWAGNVSVYASNNDGTADASGNARFFTIVYEEVPRDVCIRLAPAAAASFGAIYLGAGAGVPIKNDFTGVALDEAVITSNCVDNTEMKFIAM